MGKPVFATFSTWVTPTVAVNRGEIWDSDDPVVRSHPDWFTDDPEQFKRTSDGSYSGSPTVEQATAAPGEKRTTTTTARKPGRPRKDAGAGE